MSKDDRTAATFVPDGDAPQAAPHPTAAAPDRYQVGEVLGQGGQALVLRAYDRVLQRNVAMKVLRSPLRASTRGVERFTAEARLAAGLQHPGIVPVYDLGELPDGRFYFTMREIEGQTLQALFEHGTPLRRALQILVRVGEAVAYAHERGVIHRDLKPSNVMVGPFGEVLVLDWGIAQVLDVSSVSTAGTPAYMAPEQARPGAAIDARADVHALGGILFRALTGDPPRPGQPDSVLQALTRGEPVVRPPGDALDPALVDLAMGALHIEPEARPASATAFTEAVKDWLDGARRRERALEVVARADALAGEVEAAERDAARLARQAEALATEPSRADGERIALWQLEDEARAARVSAAELRTRLVQTLQAALMIEPELDEAHARLADHHRVMFDRAEAHGDPAEVASARRLLQSHDRAGRHAAHLRGDGVLTLLTDPSGAQVELRPYHEHHRRLVLGDPVDLGPTPLVDRVVPMGSYRLTLRAPDREPAIVHVHIERGGRWHGVPPGEVAPQPIALLPAGSLGPNERYVPAGWFWAGTGVATNYPIAEGPRWADGFVMQTHPVSNRDYLAYLNDLVAQGQVEAAEERAPRPVRGESLLGTDAAGRYVLGPDNRGYDWHPDKPVFLVSWFDAQAYAAWLAQRTGQPWRLPLELEWTKAARGADRRLYPWGNHIEPQWAKILGSPGEPGPSRLDAYPLDESPYGVRHLAGQVQEWLADPFPDGAYTDGAETEACADAG